MYWKRLLVLCAVLALAPSAAMAVLITDFAFTVGEISSSAPDSLLYEDINLSNPAVPVDVADVEFDTSTYSGDGSVLSSEIKLSGFDGPEVVTIDIDCTRWEQEFVGFPTAAMLCDVTGVSSTGGIPTLFGTELDFSGVESIVVTENGVDLDDATGDPDISFFTSASGTGTAIPVCEPAGVMSTVIGMGALFGLFVNRRL